MAAKKRQNYIDLEGSSVVLSLLLGIVHSSLKVTIFKGGHYFCQFSSVVTLLKMVNLFRNFALVSSPLIFCKKRTIFVRLRFYVKTILVIISTLYVPQNSVEI